MNPPPRRGLWLPARLTARVVSPLLLLCLTSCQRSAPPPTAAPASHAFAPIAQVFCVDTAEPTTLVSWDEIRFNESGTVTIRSCTIDFTASLEPRALGTRMQELFESDEPSAHARYDTLAGFLREIMIESGRHGHDTIFDGAVVARLALNVAALNSGLVTEEKGDQITKQLRAVHVGDPKLRKQPDQIP